MSLQVEKLEKNMAKLTIEVPASDLEKALQSAQRSSLMMLQMRSFQKHMQMLMMSASLRSFPDRRSTSYRLRRENRLSSQQK